MTISTPSQVYAISVGTTSNRASVPVYQSRDPTISDTNYTLGQEWLNTITGKLWFLVKFSIALQQVEALWENFTTSTSSVSTLTGNSGGSISPSAGNINIVGSGSVSVAGTGNTLTITSTGGLTWVNNAVTSTMLTNNGYIVTSGALILTLPTTSAVGDSLQIMLNGGTSFQIAQAAGQQIRYSASQTTIGVGGSITSTQQGNVLHLICTAANTQWQVDFSIGNMTVI